MIGALIGAGLSAAGSIFGAIKGAKERRKIQQGLNEAKADNEYWYNRMSNQDATQRADAQRALTQASDMIKQRNKEAAARKAVIGGTDATLANTTQQNANAMADTTANIAAEGDRRKDRYEQMYQLRKSALQRQQADFDHETAMNVAGATQGLLNTAGTIATSLSGLPKTKGSLNTNFGESPELRQKMSASRASITQQLRRQAGLIPNPQQTQKPISESLLKGMVRLTPNTNIL